MVGSSGTVDFVVRHLETEVQVQGDVLRELPGVQQTSAEAVGILVAVAVAQNTNTSVGDEVPHTGLAITAEQVAQVEQHLLLCVPILELVVRRLVGEHVLAFPEVHLRAKTQTRSEPLANSHGSTGEAGAESFEQTILVTTDSLVGVLLIAVPRSERQVSRDKPIAPERVGSNAVLQLRSLACLCHSGNRNTGNSQYH